MYRQRDITLSVPEDIYQRVELVASATHRKVMDVMVDTITAAFTPYPENLQRGAMKTEIAAYEAMHAELAKQFLGQYVAIYQGKLIDHDVDPFALHQRIVEQYAGKVVLSRKVQQQAAPVLHMRSPRLERLP